MKPKPKLLLINPLNPQRRLSEVIVPKVHFSISPLGLMRVAALTPAHWEIKIVDENYEHFKYEDADLVGLTAFTTHATRAYEIAAMYRKKGVKTVMGGSHVTLLPEEALKHVDIVVKGEAESIWGKVIQDFEKGSLEKIYQGEHLSLQGLPKPRYDLFKYPHYFDPIQTSRGCPFNCDFCSVTSINGHQFRHRPIEEVLDELEAVPSRYLYFVDDNLVGVSPEHEKRALTLFKGMVARGIKKRWMGFASLNIGKNKELLYWARKSGCRLLFIGLEADNIDALLEMNKKMNLRLGVDEYQQLMKRINRHGIAVLGSVIYGLDADTVKKLNLRRKFFIECGVNSLFITSLTPLPGTRLFTRFTQENRLLYTNYPADWHRYDMSEVIIKPKQMTGDELAQTISETMRQLYTPWNVFVRFFKNWWRTRSLVAAFWAYDSAKQIYPMILKPNKK